MLDGLANEELPVANTTSPSLPITNGRYSSAIGAVAVRLVQYNPPQELFMMRAPRLIRS